MQTLTQQLPMAQKRFIYAFRIFPRFPASIIKCFLTETLMKMLSAILSMPYVDFTIKLTHKQFNSMTQLLNV